MQAQSNASPLNTKFAGFDTTKIEISEQLDYIGSYSKLKVNQKKTKGVISLKKITGRPKDEIFDQR